MRIVLHEAKTNVDNILKINPIIKTLEASDI
jgi:hypothetical protein